MNLIVPPRTRAAAAPRKPSEREPPRRPPKPRVGVLAAHAFRKTEHVARHQSGILRDRASRGQVRHWCLTGIDVVFRRHTHRTTAPRGSPRRSAFRRRTPHVHPTESSRLVAAPITGSGVLMSPRRIETSPRSPARRRSSALGLGARWRDGEGRGARALKGLACLAAASPRARLAAPFGVGSGGGAALDAAPPPRHRRRRRRRAARRRAARARAEAPAARRAATRGGWRRRWRRRERPVAEFRGAARRPRSYAPRPRLRRARGEKPRAAGGAHRCASEADAAAPRGARWRRSASLRSRRAARSRRRRRRGRSRG